VRYWRQSRQVRIVVLAIGATCLGLVLPFTVLKATPSPGGATVGLAVVLALGVPVLVGWAVSRGDRLMELWSVRPIAMLDFAMMLGAGVILVAVETALWWWGTAPAGLLAARATLTYFGLLLAAMPRLGPKLASMAPTTYVIAVVLAGRGTDVDHPAPWAWVAALDDEPIAMIAAVGAFVLGALIYARTTIHVPGAGLARPDV
jgi:hypothetical protein